MKIEMSPKKVKVEIPDYGEFEVSPLGAGAEAELRMMFRELHELHEETEAYKQKPEYQEIAEKEKNGEEVDKNSEVYVKAMELFKSVTDLAQKIEDKRIEKLLQVFKGKNVEKLFNDFTIDQINEIYTKATKEDE